MIPITATKNIDPIITPTLIPNASCDKLADETGAAVVSTILIL